MSYFQNVKVDSAIIFSFNILRSVYSNFGLTHFIPVQKVFEQEHDKTALFPIINYELTSIEKRAKDISQKLPELLSKMKCKKAHIISYSLSGIDFRYYISHMNGDEYINSLTTVSSPHSGSFLAEHVNRKIIKEYNVEGLARLMGVGLHSFKEFEKENMESFNLISMNSNKTKYFSIGASQRGNLSSEMLRYNVKYISENRIRNFINDNDGAFALEETKWGKHLFNCVGDHADLIGLGNDNEWEKIYRFSIDNVKYEESEKQKWNLRNISFV